ncbi:putative DNA polymerase theta [Operophtera brumata]|uniref:Putative DNA polymerase theta n=1 Tax=Operophtera brumata TaxID=104452 RepID=A0A0L7L7E7_OPEBR|nr:putative DNA polymerase theta [Operophtera brumata]
MAEAFGEVIDSQILAENVGFLDSCFDNSFALQSSLLAVKDYVSEELREYADEKNAGQPCKKINSSIHNKTVALETSPYKRTPSQAEKQNIVSKKLKNWGLPEEIARKYEQRGITEMFDWQVTCLANSKVLLDCCNLVYSAPTSAGKTLVAEILAIKTILERQKKVIIILPFISIVREKMFYLQDILSSSGIRVEGFIGSQSPPGGLQAVHVAICTIEKANSLINRLLDDGNITELGAVIVDELHLLGDPHRGYILELLLTKIKYVSLRSDVQIQIVGMSATLPNLEVLANWLSAELFITQFRPIPLDEFCLVGNKLYNKDGNCVSSLNIAKSTNESDSVVNICLETIKESCSILIFCMTKNRCENLAQTIASSFYNLGSRQCEFGSVLRSQLKTESISEVLEQLKNCPVGLDQVLKKTISFGVAYHHAGLTFDERDIIEGAFKSGAIRVLVATSTLSSGVNLPARKVIIRSPVFMREPINILTYKQMIGRAGRMGQDTKGESILICTENEKKIGFELMMGALDPVKSCIETADKYMRAVLEMIASQVLCTKSELDLYAKCTLLFTQQNLSLSQNKLLENTLEELKNYELVRVQNDEEEIQYVATPLGKACLSASMAPNDGLSLFMELQKARQCLVLETDLHLIYLVTPYSVSSQWGDIDWLHLLTLWESLPKAMKRVGELVGVQESFIIPLALQDLVNEVPLSEVATKFQCVRGFLQSLQQAAATFAGMVTAFCRQLGWKNMEILISQFQDRLHFGINSELLELMKLPSLNGVRARTLFDSGFETVSTIASADVNVIENILHKAVPFQSEKEREGDDSYDMKKRNKIKSIWITGCCGMTAKEAAQNLIIEARKHLENEIGVTEIKWNTNVSIISKPNEDGINVNDVWDSLNFTESALGNITKLRTSAKYFSPNISFGDTDKSAASINVLDENEIKHEECKATSVKDISLFSTDADDSSFFEESLPLDLIPSRLLDNRHTSATTAMPETTVDFVSENSNSILDCFKSPSVKTEEDEDIKLIFEESDNDSLPEPCLNLSNDNEVVCSQENVKTINEFKSPYNKRTCIDDTINLNHQAKKKRLDEVAIDQNFIQKQPAIVKSTIHVNHYQLDCFLIKGNDVSNKLRVLDRIKTASIALKFKEHRSYDHAIIGSDILNVPKQKTEDNLLTGMGLYIGNDDCIFLDNTSIESNRNAIKSLFEGNVRLNVCSLKTTYVQLKKELGINLPLTSNDVCIAEWLIDSDIKTKCYTDLHHVATILADSEYHGITVDRTLASQMLIGVKRSQDILQKRADKLAGFQVLGICQSAKVSTKKSVLTCHSSPLASIVIFWRKLNCILTKTLPEIYQFGEGFRRKVILVKWNEPYQKLASCDSSGVIFVWIKYEGRWSIELINDRSTPAQSVVESITLNYTVYHRIATSLSSWALTPSVLVPPTQSACKVAYTRRSTQIDYQ